MMLEGAGFRADGKAHGAHAHRPARAGAVFGPGAADHRGARLVGRSRRAGRPDVRLHGDEPHAARSSPPARRSSTSRWASRSPRRTSAVRRSRSPSGLIHNVGRRRRRRARPRARATSSYFPSSAWSYPPHVHGRRRRHRARPRDPRHRAAQRPAGLRHARRRSTSCSTRGRRSRCSPTSARPSSPRSPASVATRSRSSPTSRMVLAGSIDVDGADKAAHFITRRRLVPPAARSSSPTTRA